MRMRCGQTLIRLMYCLYSTPTDLILIASYNTVSESFSVQGISHWVHKQHFSSFAAFYPMIFQKSSSAPSSSSQSTASNACSPSACNLSRPVRLSRNPDSLNAFDNMPNPSVSYALITCHDQKKNRHQVSHSAHRRHSQAYRLTAPCTTVVGGANDLHVAELREKSAQLMRNKTQYTSLIFPLVLLGILPSWWRRCVEAAKSGYKTPAY